MSSITLLYEQQFEMIWYVCASLHLPLLVTVVSWWELVGWELAKLPNIWRMWKTWRPRDWALTIHDGWLLAISKSWESFWGRCSKIRPLSIHRGEYHICGKSVWWVLVEEAHSQMAQRKVDGLVQQIRKTPAAERALWPQHQGAQLPLLEKS